MTRLTPDLSSFSDQRVAIILPHIDGAAALAVSEKLHVAIARARVDTERGPVRCSASFGVAALGNDVDADEMLKRAATALYGAKAGGRNICRLWRAEEKPDTGLLRRILKAGLITFNGGRSTIECTIRGLSSTGALLQVISTADIPERFKLGVVSEDLHRLCRVAAKRESRIEVTFE